MLSQPTLEKLRQMRLVGMAEAFADQLERPDVRELSFEERLGLLVDHEWTYRQNRRRSRLLKEAKLRLSASMEEIDYHQPRGLDRSVMRSLADCDWLRHHQAVLITGPTGSGKTFIACALANAACRQGFSARYYRLSKLLAEMAIAKGDGSYMKLLQKLAKIDVLVLDDWGLATLSETESRELLEVIEERTLARSTIVASQLPLSEWHGAMADPTAADAIPDRLVHTARAQRAPDHAQGRIDAEASSRPADGLNALACGDAGPGDNAERCPQGLGQPSAALRVAHIPTGPTTRPIDPSNEGAGRPSASRSLTRCQRHSDPGGRPGPKCLAGIGRNRRPPSSEIGGLHEP